MFWQLLNSNRGDLPIAPTLSNSSAITGTANSSPLFSNPNLSEIQNPDLLPQLSFAEILTAMMNPNRSPSEQLSTLPPLIESEPISATSTLPIQTTLRLDLPEDLARKLTAISPQNFELGDPKSQLQIDPRPQLDPIAPPNFNPIEITTTTLDQIPIKSVSQIATIANELETADLPLREILHRLISLEKNQGFDQFSVTRVEISPPKIPQTDDQSADQIQNALTIHLAPNSEIVDDAMPADVTKIDQGFDRFFIDNDQNQDQNQNEISSKSPDQIIAAPPQFVVIDVDQIANNEVVEIDETVINTKIEIDPKIFGSENVPMIAQSPTTIETQNPQLNTQISTTIEVEEPQPIVLPIRSVSETDHRFQIFADTIEKKIKTELKPHFPAEPQLIELVKIGLSFSPVDPTPIIENESEIEIDPKIFGSENVPMIAEIPKSEIQNRQPIIDENITPKNDFSIRLTFDEKPVAMIVFDQNFSPPIIDDKKIASPQISSEKTIQPKFVREAEPQLIAEITTQLFPKIHDAIATLKNGDRNQTVSQTDPPIEKMEIEVEKNKSENETESETEKSRSETITTNFSSMPISIENRSTLSEISPEIQNETVPIQRSVAVEIRPKKIDQEFDQFSVDHDQSPQPQTLLTLRFDDVPTEQIREVIAEVQTVIKSDGKSFSDRFDLVVVDGDEMISFSKPLIEPQKIAIENPQLTAKNPNSEIKNPQLTTAEIESIESIKLTSRRTTQPLRPLLVREIPASETITTTPPKEAIPTIKNEPTNSDGDQTDSVVENFDQLLDLESSDFQNSEKEDQQFSASQNRSELDPNSEISENSQIRFEIDTPPIDDQITEPSREISEAREQIIDEIRTQNRIRTRQRELTIRLRPEHLGRLVVKISQENGNAVGVQIETATAEAQQFLIAEMADLHTELAEHGIIVQNIEISVNPDDSNSGNNFQQNQQMKTDPDLFSSDQQRQQRQQQPPRDPQTDQEIEQTRSVGTQTANGQLNLQA